MLSKFQFYALSHHSAMGYTMGRHFNSHFEPSILAWIISLMPTVSVHGPLLLIIIFGMNKQLPMEFSQRSYFFLFNFVNNTHSMMHIQILHNSNDTHSVPSSTIIRALSSNIIRATLLNIIRSSGCSYLDPINDYHSQLQPVDGCSSELFRTLQNFKTRTFLKTRTFSFGEGRTHVTGRFPKEVIRDHL